MKIRTGFVTNSSTSSFCIVGTRFDSVIGGGEDPKTENKRYSLADLLADEELEGISAYYSFENDALYAGLKIEDMKGKETMDEFTAKAEEGVKKFIKALTKKGYVVKQTKPCHIINETIDR